MHVCVLGAGIAGLSCAWRLAEAGHDVTVVDRSGPAAGASRGNGGQLSYGYVQPLAGPSLWLQLPSLLLSPRSPLRVRPRLDPAQWRWALRFLAACNAARSLQTTQRLLALAALSRGGLEDFLRREQVDCDFTTTGKLVLYRSERALRGAIAQMQLQRTLGGPRQEAVTAAEAMAIEPALAHQQEGLAGAIHTPGECAADCQKVCDALAAALASRGARLAWGGSVQGLAVHHGRAVEVATDAGRVAADAFVVALGTGSTPLARQLGVDLPVYPLKGYSVTLDIARDAAVPRVSITDSARKVVFARLGRRLRVAGMAELVGDDPRIPQARTQALLDATEALFPGGCSRADPRPWAGMRPATPTGEPLVGRLAGAPRNVLFNSGHGALGFTLAFGTAQRVCESLDSA
jgi:D-amino-acid dehydrogenase